MTIMKVSFPSLTTKIRGCLPFIHLKLGKFPDFHYVVQDEIQHYHLNKDQCTLHPVVIYHKEAAAKELQCTSICFLSNDLEHDTNFATTRMNLVSMICGLFFATSHGKSPVMELVEQ